MKERNKSNEYLRKNILKKGNGKSKPVKYRETWNIHGQQNSKEHSGLGESG